MFSILALLSVTACGPASVEPTQDVNAIIHAAETAAFEQVAATALAAPTLTPPESTVTPTPIPLPTQTSAPIPEPVAAVARSNVTVRGEPRRGGDNLGGIFFNQGMKVIARNDNATWYYIEWEKSPTGAAWVTAPAVDMKDNDITRLPIAIINSAGRVVVLPPLLWEITGTPLPLNPPAAGAQTAFVLQLARVRVGPGIGYMEMGTLDSGATVSVTGRIDGNEWLQIEYPSGPGGRGWIAGELTQMQGVFAGLPFYNRLATPIGDPDQGSAPTADPNATSEPTITPQPTLAGPPGQVTANEVNIRSGPASNSDLLGTLKLGDPVVVTGLTVNRFWYRIVHPGGPGGYAWVATAYIKITGGDMRNITFFNDQGTPLP